MLLEERVNAKLLQFKLKRLGIEVSLWEIFSLFEFVNMRHAKMAYEPQRYHYVMFEHLYKAMTASDYQMDILCTAPPESPSKGDKKKKKEDDKKKSDKKKKDDDQKDKSDSDKEEKEQSEKKSSSSSSSKSSSSSSSSSDTDSDGSLCASEREHRRLKKRDAKLAKLSHHQVKHVFSIDVK